MGAKSLRSLVSLVSLVSLAGCAGVSVEAQAPEQTRALERADALAGVLSRRSERKLYRLGLLDRFREEPRATLAELDRRLLAEGERSLAYLLAEACTLVAGEEEGAARERCLGSAATYAWAYLFDPGLVGSASPFDPRYRGACELYNNALARLLDLGVEEAERRRGEGFELPTLGEPIEVRPGAQELAWEASAFESFLPTDAMRPEGLAVLNHDYGIGVPCVALRAAATREPSEGEVYLPKLRQSYAATLLIRFEGTIRERDRSGSSYRGRSELYDPLLRRSVEVASREVPLESDLSTPLAHFLRQVPTTSVPALLDVEALEQRRLGLFMLQPFSPDKIPVVFVHGLMSEPLTWLPMLNALLGDPLLRARYQFLFFFYPTGNPLLTSADLLRTSLQEFARRFDPAGTNRLMRQSVLVGHSMGGVISRLQVQDSSEGQLWAAFSERSLDSLSLDDELRAQLRRSFYFRPLPWVRRVVFMAAPHRGASLAEGVVGAIGSAFVTLPQHTLDSYARLAVALEREEEAGTGIDGLSPRAPVMRASMALPLSPAVTYHTVVGNQAAQGEPGGSDGVVPYASSHLEGAASELIVRSGHSVQQTSPGIAEVARILREHLAGLEAAPSQPR